MEITKLGSQSGDISDQNLKEGAKVFANVVQKGKDNNYLLLINGKSYSASSSDLLSGRVRVVIVGLEPQLEVMLLADDDEGVTSQLQKLDNSLLAKLASKISNLDLQDIQNILKKLDSLNIKDFSVDELKRLIKDSGLFFENKLKKGENIAADAKLEAIISGATQQEALTKLQSLNYLLQNELLLFFMGRQLDFDDATMRFKKGDDGSFNLFLKVVFTNLGKTIISFKSSQALLYNVTVRTEQDISEQLAKIDLKGVKIRWVKLSESDEKLFKIKGEDLKGFNLFNMLV